MRCNCSKALAEPDRALYTLVGGPFNGQRMPLTDGTTMTFSLGKHKGRYQCAIPGHPRSELWPSITGEAKWRRS